LKLKIIQRLLKFLDLGQISSEEEGEVETGLVEGADDQQAAEAMVQLGNFGFFANPQQGNIFPFKQVIEIYLLFKNYR